MIDFLIIGAGVTGVALAREVAVRAPKAKIVVLEKSPGVASQASGRNSGVVHAGYNQKPGTLKAKLCVEGNRRLREFCRKHQVPLKEDGILIVAQDGEEPVLETLLRQGRANGVEGLKILGHPTFREHEPHAVGRLALHAPTGATVDSRSFVRALASDARERGVEFRFGSGLRTVERRDGAFVLKTAVDELRATRLVNCAGAQADRVAHALGAGLEYTVVPFRGEYFLYKGASPVRSALYAAPDLAFPFLGVHWTVLPNGTVKVGPNAVLGLGREAESTFDVDWRDLAELATSGGFWRMWLQPGFLRTARRYFWTSAWPTAFLRRALGLVEGARLAQFERGPSGVRAQLVDRQGRLVDDLTLEEKDGALHVLNVVSPGLTCSLPFAEHLADRLV